ncbi:Floral homeotic protein [Ranunculus cassubicifolius]
MKKRVTEMQKTGSSKRKLGLVKKAQQLSVLCDAKVSLIIFSATGNLTEYTSPNTTTKMIFDEYQQVSGEDLWETHYQALEDELKREMEINRKLHKEYNQMIGEDLDDLSICELGNLKQCLEKSLNIVSETKIPFQAVLMKEGNIGLCWLISLAASRPLLSAGVSLFRWLVHCICVLS